MSELGAIFHWQFGAPWQQKGRSQERGPWARTQAAREQEEGRWQAYRGVGDFGAVGNKRAVGKKEGRGPVRRAVGKKEGRGQARWAVGHLRPASNERAAINTEARIHLEARTKTR